jgi:murein DD-endopeptidase MepM/ murein hydrolase activator NlpD
MTIQAPRPSRPANPFLNSLDKPAPRLSVLSSTSPVQPERKPQPKAAPQKSPAFVLLGWIIVGLLLAWPAQFCLKPAKPPEPRAKVPAVPVRYNRISSPFGPRWGRQHQGIDFAAEAGSPIYAASSGKVIHSGWQAGYGNSIVIEHSPNRQTRYAHCARLLVPVGAQVTKGDVIATVGSTGHSTGPHLHFEVIVDGERKNPVWFYPLEVAQRLPADKPGN